jgi:hypothetical protein
MVFGPFHYCAFCERAAPDTVVSPKIARVFSELMWKAKLSAVDIAGGCMASNVGPLAFKDPETSEMEPAKHAKKTRKN